MFQFWSHCRKLIIRDEVKILTDHSFAQVSDLGYAVYISRCFSDKLHALVVPDVTVNSVFRMSGFSRYGRRQTTL